MRLSKTEECLLLDYHLQRGVYMDIVKNQLEIHHITIPIEEAMSRIAASVFSNTTTKEWNNYIKSRDVLRSIFLRRKYDVWNFFATKEAMESRYPDGAPEIVNIDHEIMPPKTLQLGLYVLYLTTEVIKPDPEVWANMDDDEKDGYERFKDWHDFLNGYLNQETIQNPLIAVEDVLGELSEKREIIENHIKLFFGNMSR